MQPNATEFWHQRGMQDQSTLMIQGVEEGEGSVLMNDQLLVKMTLRIFERVW